MTRDYKFTASDNDGTMWIPFIRHGFKIPSNNNHSGFPHRDVFKYRVKLMKIMEGRK